MNGEPEQLVLDLPHRPALGAEDFLVSPANRSAVALVDLWPDWPHACAMVVGPPQSGKTHLANVWRARSGAGAALAAASLTDSDAERLAATTAAVVEDLDRGIGDERALFHMLNIAREHRAFVLLTSSVAPGDLTVRLPDLRSRLRALPVVRIEPPDEDLLRPVLVKLFCDRQLQVEPSVIAYLSRHMERSFAAAACLVSEIDRRALATRRRVTRTLAAEVLALSTASGREM
jgi:chromosomal replication initiation ATPase DnaA